VRLPDRKKYVLTLAALLGAVFVWSGVAPRDRGVWLLENALTVVGVGILVATAKKLPLSRVSYTLIFLFTVLHVVGSHYRYADVPTPTWLDLVLGGGEQGERNHYDRLVHFCYGLLLAYPMREVVLRIGDFKGFWGYFLPLDVTMSTSMLYELIEWAAAVVFADEAAMEFLGTQGDEWDAHKDMLLASVGALIAMLVTAAINRRLQRDFNREWNESLRVKEPRPLGEEEAARLIRQQERDAAAAEHPAAPT